jgi:hypothetical protein
MTEPPLVFAGQHEHGPELVVNFGVFSGREATEAEIYRLGQLLLDEVVSVEIVSERRYEFDQDVEATVHQVRVELPASAEVQVETLRGLVDAWATDCIIERKLTP